MIIAMTLRKLLLYGGCHALILRDLLMEHFAERVVVTLLVNFEIIRLGRPFPYEDLHGYDVVIYSPIENKGEYNTMHLVEACRVIGVETICYPWMEWHGYCPGAVKGEFKNRYQWRFPALIEAATGFDSFPAFADWAIEAFPDDAAIDACLAYSTALLRSAEERHAMPVRIADFVMEQHRHSRLFLISDHPSLALYLHVMRQILALLGIADGGTCERLERHGEEPQWRHRTPIFPRVATRLDLRFSDTAWFDDDIVQGRGLDLRSYLRLYFHHDSVILGPLGDAGLTPALGDGAAWPVSPSTRLLADELTSADRRTHDRYRLVEVLSGEPIPLERDDPFEIDRRQWRTAWG